MFNQISRAVVSRNLLTLNSALRSRVLLYSKSAAEESRIFWQKNAKLNRPLSPHLTIYRLPLTANMSIMHRATGGILSGFIILFGLGSYYYGGGNSEKFFEFLRDNVHPHLMLAIKFILVLPLVYHTSTGIRHLIWDTGKFLQLAHLYKSGYTIIPLVFLISLALATM